MYTHSMPIFMIKHSKLTSALVQLTTILVSSSEEPLYTAVVEQCGTGGGTVGENHIPLHFTISLMPIHRKWVCDLSTFLVSPSQQFIHSVIFMTYSAISLACTEPILLSKRVSMVTMQWHTLCQIKHCAN